MALARLALKNLQKSVTSSSSLLSPRVFIFEIERRVGVAKQQRWDSEIMRRFSTTASENVSSDGKEISVSEGDRKKSKLFPKKLRRRGGGLWRNERRDLLPFDLNYLFPSGLGDALLRASENINKLFESLGYFPLISRVMKEHDDFYKLRFQVPGLAKDDVKIIIEDGFLRIRGEHKEGEEEEEGLEDEHWSSCSHRYYDTSLMLPDDAKIEEIKAEMKDGMLYITIPRTEGKKKEVKEVKIN